MQIKEMVGGEEGKWNEIGISVYLDGAPVVVDKFVSSSSAFFLATWIYLTFL